MCGYNDGMQLVPVEHRLQAYYCATLVRELDLRLQCSSDCDHSGAQVVPVSAAAKACYD